MAWSELLRHSVLWVALISCVVLYAIKRKWYPILYLVSIALYIFTAIFSIDAFSMSKESILLLLSLSTAVMIGTGYALSRQIQQSQKNNRGTHLRAKAAAGILLPIVIIILTIVVNSTSLIVFSQASLSDADSSSTIPSLHERFDYEAKGWSTWREGWHVVDGTYVGSNTGANIPTETFYEPGANWTDYVVEADVTMLSSHSPSTAQLLLRYKTSGYDGTAYDMVECRIFEGSDGRQLMLTTPQDHTEKPFAYQAGKSYRLRASAIGEKLTCEVVGEPQTLLTLTTKSRSGTIGLRNTHIEARFDNVLVTPA